jgi:hypothetical protein
MLAMVVVETVVKYAKTGVDDFTSFLVTTLLRYTMGDHLRPPTPLRPVVVKQRANGPMSSAPVN